MSRARHTDRPTPKKVYIRKSLVDQTDASCFDPLTQKARHGAWTDLMNSLLGLWLEGKVPEAAFQPFRANLDDLKEQK